MYDHVGPSQREYVCVPLDVPHSGTTLTERGKTVGFVKRWALQTTVVLFGEDEAEGMDDLKPEPRQARASVPDMTAPATPEDIARKYIPRLNAAIMASGGDIEAWYKLGEEKFKGLLRSKWEAPQYEYMLRWVKASQQGQKVTAAEQPA